MKAIDVQKYIDIARLYPDLSSEHIASVISKIYYHFKKANDYLPRYNNARSDVSRTRFNNSINHHISMIKNTIGENLSNTDMEIYLHLNNITVSILKQGEKIPL